MLQALLESAGLTPDDVEIVEYPDFGQATALQQGAVDAATGFANNEPIQLENAGHRPGRADRRRRRAAAGPGPRDRDATLAAKEDALRRSPPRRCGRWTRSRRTRRSGSTRRSPLVPDLAQDPALQRQILDATIAPGARGDAPYGAIDRDGWQQSLDFMGTLGLVPNPVTVDQLVDDSLLGS